MSTVYNWHLGRKMKYPYQAAYPKRQFAFVFNINRCIACQTCTMACKSTWTFSLCKMGIRYLNHRYDLVVDHCPSGNSRNFNLWRRDINGKADRGRIRIR